MFDKIFIFILTISILFSFALPAQSVTQWNVNLPQATDTKSNWPSEAQAQWSIVDSLLSNYRRAMYLTYASSASLTVGSGEVVVSTAGASPRLFLQNANALTLTAANLDTGASFAVSTTYYVYAGATSSTASTATGYISLSNTAPAGVTYYLNLGSFTTDSSGNIAHIVDNSVVARIASPSVNGYGAGVSYQCTTDLFIVATCAFTGGPCQFISDSSPTPTTVVSSLSVTGSNQAQVVGWCRKGDYWRTANSTASITAWPLGQ